jgi:hypothetical protein
MKRKSNVISGEGIVKAARAKKPKGSSQVSVSLVLCEQPTDQIQAQLRRALNNVFGKIYLHQKSLRNIRRNMQIQNHINMPSYMN